MIEKQITKLLNYEMSLHSLLASLAVTKLHFNSVIQLFSNSVIHRKRSFTLIELVVSVALFIIAISIALFAVVGTNGLIQKADARGAISESTRSVGDMIRQTVKNAPVGGVSLLPASGTAAAIQVKSFSNLQSGNTCTVIGRATASTSAGGEEKYTIDTAGTIIAIIIYNLDAGGLCPQLNPIYQNRLTNPQATVKDAQFSLQNISYQTVTKQLLRYSLTIEALQKGSGGTSEARLPTLTVQEGLPIGLVNEAILPLKIDTTSLVTGTVNQPYTDTLVASGGVPGYTWSVVSGSLPNGLSLASSSGTISGTPTGSGTKNFVVKADDSTGSFVTASLAITIYSLVAITSPDINPVADEGVIYTSNPLTATGGSGSYLWSLEANSQSPSTPDLKCQLVIDRFSCNPPIGSGSAFGKAYSFEVEVRDANNPDNKATTNLVLKVKAGGGSQGQD